MPEQGLVQEQINNLLKKARAGQYTIEEVETIQRAANFANQKHDGQIRKSGEPYIIHPLAVASFLIDWKMDVDSVVAGLLHDVVEDTPTKLEEIKVAFNQNVARLVDYVSKASEFARREGATLPTESDYTIKLFLSMMTDIRAMIIKLADRYHNMLTIQYLSPERQQRMAQETMDLYANVAGRLGMYELKTKLLDLAFQVLQPKDYAKTKAQIEDQVNKNDGTWHEMIGQIAKILDSYGVKYHLSTRVKGVYSTYEKLRKNFSIWEIHDIFALRIVVDQPLECYEVLGLIHLNFCYIKRTLKDYISNPKLNLYQSIHTTLNKDGAMIEVQIRTKQMDVSATIGIANHWYYKEMNDSKTTQKIENTVNTLLLNEFLNHDTLEQIHEATHDDLFDVLILNKNQWLVTNHHSTLLDIAYRFDRDNFYSLTEILKNGQTAPFDSLMDPGDTIKFKYADHHQVMVNEHWLRDATLPQIREAIQKKLDEARVLKQNNLTIFLQEVATFLGDNCLPLSKILKVIKDLFGLTNLEKFFEFVEFTKKDNTFFANLFHKSKVVRKKAFSQVMPIYANWILEEASFKPIPGLMITALAWPTCCQKIPGVNTVGVVEKGTLFIHDYRCSNISRTQKLVQMEWDTARINAEQKRFPYHLSFRAHWTPSIGNNIVQNLTTFSLLLNQITIEQDNLECRVQLNVQARNIIEINSFLQALEQSIMILDKPRNDPAKNKENNWGKVKWQN